MNGNINMNFAKITKAKIPQSGKRIIYCRGSIS